MRIRQALYLGAATALSVTVNAPTDLRGLAVPSLKRSDVLPDIPTTLEAGYSDSD
jgi:tripartite-type tricarboxylate transporter receptor subunit TctC